MFKILGKFGRFLVRQSEAWNPDVPGATTATDSPPTHIAKQGVQSLFPIIDGSTGRVIGYTPGFASSSVSETLSYGPSVIPAHSLAPSTDRTPTTQSQSPLDIRSRSSSPIFKLRNGVYVPVEKVQKASTKRVKHVLPESDSETEPRFRKKSRPASVRAADRNLHLNFRARQSTPTLVEGPPNRVNPTAQDVHLSFVAKAPDAPLPTVETREGEELINSAHIYMKSENLEETWDGYPDGDFSLNVSYEVFAKTKNLLSHWAAVVGGGDRAHERTASTWQEGKRATRKCLGFIKCTNEKCDILIRPQTKTQFRAQQLEKRCICGSVLRHLPCRGGESGTGVVSALHTWKGGVYYINGGFHRHPRPTHELHLTSKATAEFRKLVMGHPSAGPLKCVTGLQQLDGTYGPSSATIAPPLLNADYVGYQRNKIKRASNLSGSHFLRQYSAFKARHPGFVIQEQLDETIVISMQGNFMKSMLVREVIRDRPLNGMVSDAAHGWWRVKNDLLITTSVYCALLCCWTPVVFSFSNGASGDHFAHHFYSLFRSMAQQAAEQNVTLTVLHLANVMDFSAAERIGFIRAYVRFFGEEDENTLTEEELEREAETLLKGCAEHFRAACTRIARIGDIIAPETRDRFLKMCDALHTTKDLEQFQETAAHIIEQWPKTLSWLSWWMQPAHAAMIFRAHLRMNIVIHSMIPSTTNAQEAMHWKLYSAAGRDHDVMDGFEALFATSEYFGRIYQGVKVGSLIRYRQAEPWKIMHEKYGRTKPSRAPDADPAPDAVAPRQVVEPKAPRAAVNDGRPPDTRAKLQNRSEKKAKKEFDANLSTLMSESPHKTKATSTQLTLSGIPWEANSCWLDASCTAINAVARWDWDTFSQAFLVDKADKESIFGALHVFMTALYTQQELTPSRTTRNQINTRRNNFRNALIAAKLAEAVTVDASGNKHAVYETAFGWLNEALRKKRDNGFASPQSVFHGVELEVRFCAGSALHHALYPDKFEHIWIRNPRIAIFKPFNRERKQFQGSLEAWLQDRTTIHDVKRGEDPCWRTINGKPLCGNKATATKFLTHLPLCLIISFSEERLAESWDIPALIQPTASVIPGLRYEIVSRVFFVNANHFVTHSRLPSIGDPCIYTHDGMSSSGNLLPVQGGTVQTHLSGPKVLHPPLSKSPVITTEVVYRLCGGRAAQSAFVSHQLQRASQLFHFDFSSTSPIQIPQVDLNRPEYRRREAKEIDWSTTSGLKEYEWTKVAPQLPTFHPHDPLSDAELESEDASPGAIQPPEDFKIADTPSAAISSSPAPDESLPFDCRCGAEGDGHRFEIKEESIECSTCQRWSHLACQRGLSGMARRPRLDIATFECHRCSTDSLREMMHGSTAYFRAESKRLETDKALILRLLPGKGALVRLGSFYYPCRLISVRGKTWNVKLWRHCIFPPESSYRPGEYRTAKETDIQDECWKNRKIRRSIRLGEWTITHLIKEIREDEDSLSTSVVGFTSEIDKALLPHRDLLLALTLHPLDVASDSTPALAWLRESKSRPVTASVPFNGGIAKDDWSRIDNWLAERLNPVERRLWVSLVPMAHAGTLLLATRIQSDEPEVTWAAAIERAWERQVFLTGKTLNGDVRQEVDVDLEAIEMLEDRMFDQSEAAGIAGNCQWGLDAGHHQNNWSPYHHNRSGWIENIREGSESECTTGREFVHHRKPAELAEDKPGAHGTRPQPQARRKNTRKKSKEGGSSRGRELGI